MITPWETRLAAGRQARNDLRAGVTQMGYLCNHCGRFHTGETDQVGRLHRPLVGIGGAAEATAGQELQAFPFTLYIMPSLVFIFLSCCQVLPPATFSPFCIFWALCRTSRFV